MTAECPVCHDFAGAVESVEAHISGSTSGAHQGALGEDYRGAMGTNTSWKAIAAVAGVFLGLYLIAQGGGSEPRPETEGEDQATVRVDPAIVARGEV